MFTALTAQLPAAAATGVARLSALAGQSSDCGDMLSALPELADVLRYGEARAIDTAQLQALFARIAALARLGVNIIVLLALADNGHPGYDPNLAGLIAALGIPVFGCTPDRFPDLMAAAL